MCSFLSRGRWKDIAGGGLSCRFEGGGGAVTGLCLRVTLCSYARPWATPRADLVK